MDIEPILAVNLFALLCNLNAFHSNLFCIVAKQPYREETKVKTQKLCNIQNTFLIILKMILNVFVHLHLNVP